MPHSRLASKTVLFIAALCTATEPYTASAASINLGFSRDFSVNNPVILIKKNNRNYYPETKDKLGNNLYNQNVGFDPAGWLLGGPAVDASASALARPYYESYGYHSVPRNYIYYDWGW